MSTDRGRSAVGAIARHATYNSPHDGPGVGARLARGVALVVALLMGLAGLTTLHLAPALAQATRASGGGPVVNWASNMIYAGQNNDNPEGPVGELASVNGSGFTAGASVNLVLAPGDSASNPAVCQSGAIPIGSDITVQNDGTFTFAFTWPNTANSGDYSACALNSSDGSVITGADGGPFHVLSANQPAIQVSNSSAAAGASVTISGSNWLPPQPITVFIATCHNCDASPLVSANPSSDSNGAFSVQLTIPGGASPGSYVASAFTTNNDVLDVGLTGGAVALTINPAAATPTPTVHATTPTTQATTAPGGGGGAGGQNTTGGSDNLPYIIAIIVAVVVLLVALVGVITYLLLRRRRGAPGFPTPSQAGGAYGGSYTPSSPGGYGAPASRPAGVTGPNTPPDWRVLPNWDGATTELIPGGPGGVPGAPQSPSAPGLRASPGPQTPQTPQTPQGPITQSTQPVLPNPNDSDAPTLPGNYPG